MEQSDPITSVDALTPKSLTDRLSRNGFLEAGEVLSIEETDPFDSSAAFFKRPTITYSEDNVGSASDDMMLKPYREGWFGGRMDVLWGAGTRDTGGFRLHRLRLWDRSRESRLPLSARGSMPLLRE